jgi:hypothetical protein
MGERVQLELRTVVQKRLKWEQENAATERIRLNEISLTKVVFPVPHLY